MQGGGGDDGSGDGEGGGGFDLGQIAGLVGPLSGSLSGVKNIFNFRKKKSLRLGINKNIIYREEVATKEVVMVAVAVVLI